MTAHERVLITIAKLALEAIDLSNGDLPPPVATEAELIRRHKPASKPADVPRKPTGRPKGALDYICLACKHGFRAVKPIYCPNPDCGAHSNFVLKKDYNREPLPAA